MAAQYLKLYDKNNSQEIIDRIVGVLQKMGLLFIERIRCML